MKFEICKELFESGRLTEVLGFQIESIKPSIISGHPAIDYNSFAWAAGYSDRWWGTTSEDFWPTGVTREETLQAYINAYKVIGYEICNSESFEEGFEKIAIYVDDNKKPKHAARQLSNGRWTSKMGRFEDVEHEFSKNLVITELPPIQMYSIYL